MAHRNNEPERPLLIFDCDPGCDDALAIALVAQKPHYARIDLLTVAGNVSVDQTTANACRMVALLDTKKCKTVFRGCSRGFMGDIPSAASVHGRDGLGEAPNNLLSPPLKPTIPEPNTNAVARLIDLSSEKCEGNQFDLLCTGPVTNVATALNLMDYNQRLTFLQRCKRFVVMGGSFEFQGNITHSAEFNAFFDPVAMQIVLDFMRECSESTPLEIHFVPLDATETVGVSLSKRDTKKTPNNVATFLFYALQQYGEFHAFHCKRPDDAAAFGIQEFDEEAYVRSQLAGSLGVSKLGKFCYLHDPLAAWVLLNWEEAGHFWEDAEIRIDTGRGDSRGRIIRCASKQGDKGPYKPIELGTKVKWLDFRKDKDGSRATTVRGKCVTEIQELLCLPVVAPA